MAKTFVGALFPNQHNPLHILYGQQGCCLCGAQMELQSARYRINVLEAELLKLKSGAMLPKADLSLRAPVEAPRNRRERRREPFEDYGIVRYDPPCGSPPDDPPSE